MELVNPNSSAEQRRGIIKTAVAILVFIAAVLALFLNKMLTPRVMSPIELRANGAIVFEKPRVVEDFSLIDHRGEPFNLARFQGKWSYIFLGFTHCPDICPNTMAKLAEVYKQLDETTRQNTQIILLSVDPARDTQEKLEEYVPFFHEDFIGLTGDFLQVMKISGNVNAAFSKVALEGDDYTIDHTANIAVINPKGHYQGFLKPPFELAKLKTSMYSISKLYDE